MFPEIIRDGRLFIAEPPLYRVADKKDPFVINKKDYLERYVREASKYYKLGYKMKKTDVMPEYLNKTQWKEFLSKTKNYVKDMFKLVDRYKINGRLLEMILEEFAFSGFNKSESMSKNISKINIQHMMDRICIEFPEMYYDDKSNIIRGANNNKFQTFEITEQRITKAIPLIEIIQEWAPPENGVLVLKDIKTNVERDLSLLEALKILKKYQPDILHRFKGLGENDDEDIKTTIMNPDTRTLIRVNIGDIENDMKVFQILRGNTPADSLARKMMMSEFRIDKEDIDT